MKKGLLVILGVMLLGSFGICQAEDAVATAADTSVESCQLFPGVDTTLDATYVTRYMFRGFDMTDDKAAWQPRVTFDMADYNLKVWTQYTTAATDGAVNTTEYRYGVAYYTTMNEGLNCQADMEFGYTYFDYTDMPTDAADFQELYAKITMPNVFDFGLVPTYTAVYSWDAKQGGINDSLRGFIHVLGVEYDWTVAGFLPDNPEQTFTFAAQTVYNDGVDYMGADVDHDWSHIVWSVSTKINMGPGTLVPALYYQNSMDDSVNTEDELWAGITYSLKF